MKVADLPADHRRSARIAPELNLENRLGRLRDHVGFTALAMKNRSIGERMIKIKAKLPSILSDTLATAALPTSFDLQASKTTSSSRPG